MKIKVNVLIISIVLAIILFAISTYMQRQLVDYEAKVSCLILTSDVLENELVDESKFKLVEVPISLVANQKIITSTSEISGLYAKDNIKAGQIAMRTQFDTKENLSIFEAENGKEKLSIKIKASENGMSFQIKENSYVNVYATIRNDLGINFLTDKARLTIGDEVDGYTVIKMLENIKVLGVFTADGIEYDKSLGDNADSILICVTPEEAKEINLIREIATFNITGVNVEKKESLPSNSGDAIVNIGSGDAVKIASSGEKVELWKFI